MKASLKKSLSRRARRLYCELWRDFEAHVCAAYRNGVEGVLGNQSAFHDTATEKAGELKFYQKQIALWEPLYRRLIAGEDVPLSLGYVASRWWDFFTTYADDRFFGEEMDGLLEFSDLLEVPQ